MRNTKDHYSRVYKKHGINIGIKEVLYEEVCLPLLKIPLTKFKLKYKWRVISFIKGLYR